MAPNTKLFEATICCPLEEKYTANVKEEFHLSTWQQPKEHSQVNHPVSLKDVFFLDPSISTNSVDRTKKKTAYRLMSWRHKCGTISKSDYSGGRNLFKTVIPIIKAKITGCSALRNDGGFASPFLIHCPKLAASHFYLWLFISAYPKENGKISFDLIGFHSSLQGNKY